MGGDPPPTGSSRTRALEIGPSPMARASKRYRRHQRFKSSTPPRLKSEVCLTLISCQIFQGLSRLFLKLYIWDYMMKCISLLTFTLNSARELDRLLRYHEEIVDEIIVIDGYSSDNTIEVAKK